MANKVSPQSFESMRKVMNGFWIVVPAYLLISLVMPFLLVLAALLLVGPYAGAANRLFAFTWKESANHGSGVKNIVVWLHMVAAEEPGSEIKRVTFMLTSGLSCQKRVI
jgi:hypothetical protein